MLLGACDPVAFEVDPSETVTCAIQSTRRRAAGLGCFIALNHHKIALCTGAYVLHMQGVLSSAQHSAAIDMWPSRKQHDYTQSQLSTSTPQLSLSTPTPRPQSHPQLHFVSAAAVEACAADPAGCLPCCPC